MLRRSLIALAAVAAALAAVATLRGTSAAFTDEQTTEFQLKTGSVAIQRDGDGLVFSSAPLAPGDSASATVKVTNTGTLPAKLTLSREQLESTSPGGCSVSDAMRLKVADGDATISDGPLAGNVELGTLAAGESRSYDVTLIFAAQHGASATDNDNCFEGSLDRERFGWQAVQS